MSGTSGALRAAQHPVALKKLLDGLNDCGLCCSWDHPHVLCEANASTALLSDIKVTQALGHCPRLYAIIDNDLCVLLRATVTILTAVADQGLLPVA